MTEFLIYFCDSLIIWTAASIVGTWLFQTKIENYIKLIINILLFSTIVAIFNLYDIEVFHGVIKIICIYILHCIFFKFIFKKAISTSMNIALIWYLCMCISEVIIVLLASLILSYFNNLPIVLKNTILMNFLITSFNLIMISKLKNLLIQFINNKYTKRVYSILIVIILITMSIILFRQPVTKWVFNAEFIITMLTLFGFCILALYLLKQKSDIEKTTSMYQQLAEYSEMTNKVLEEYRMVNHEHKNQLSIIRQMSDKKNKKLIEYLDNLLVKKNDIKYKWVSDLNYIPLDGLKGLINYKLIEMENNKINSSVSISKEIEKLKLDKLTTNQKDSLYSIVGIYLDNALDASYKSRKKEISIEIYKDKKDLVFIIGNTYEGEINLAKIDEYGYSSKGKNHGVGLHIVKKIIEEEKIFSQNRKILDDYFIQELRINTNSIKKK